MDEPGDKTNEAPPVRRGRRISRAQALRIIALRLVKDTDNGHVPVRRGHRIQPELAAYVAAYERGFPKGRHVCRTWNFPCPFIACRFHLFLDVHPLTGQIKYNFPGLEPWEIPETCSLRVAEKMGRFVDPGCALEVVGQYLGVTREGARQIQIKGFGIFREDGDYTGFSDHDDDAFGVRDEVAGFIGDFFVGDLE